MSDDGGDGAEAVGPVPPKVVEYDPITGECSSESRRGRERAEEKWRC